MAGRSLPSARSLFETCSEMMMAIHRLPQPVIAQVHGIATAAGCQLVAACDLAIASEDARFATSGVRYGLFCSTPMVEVSRAVGRKRALEMLLTGDMIDAQTAADWGLVNRVVPRERLAEETLELATRIATASSHALAVGKAAFYEQITSDSPKPTTTRPRSWRPTSWRPTDARASTRFWASARRTGAAGPSPRAGRTARRGCPTGRRRAEIRLPRARSGALCASPWARRARSRSRSP